MIATLAAEARLWNEPNTIQTALIVDDSPVERLIAGSIVERCTDLRVIYAVNGAEALELAANQELAVVLTDMQMPKVDGMELVARMKATHPKIPVILMTSLGSEEAAITALRNGAANYIPKCYLRQELPAVLAQTLTVARTDRRRYELMSRLVRLECDFELGNDPSLVPVLVVHLQEHAERLGLCDRNGRIRLGVALEESLLNGIYHGNLEVSSELKQGTGEAFFQLASRRRLQEPYASRRLFIQVKIDGQEARFVVRDEGPGFDISKILDPTDPENLLKPSGRGLMLIRMFMDEAIHNAKGNELTLVMRRKP